MPGLIKHFCHMCGHFLNGLAKEILTPDGLMLCLECGPKIGLAILGGAWVIRELSTLYDEDRGTHCKNGIPNSWSAKIDYRRTKKHYYVLLGYTE